MIFNPEINAIKNQIEKSKLNIGYNKENNQVNIGTVQNNYYIQVKLPKEVKGTPSQIEQRANEVGEKVKGYLLKHPDDLKKIDPSVEVAAIILANTTAGSVAISGDYMTTGNGHIIIPFQHK